MVGQRKKISAFPVSAIYFIEIVHDKWCLDKSAGETENDFHQHTTQFY